MRDNNYIKQAHSPTGYKNTENVQYIILNTYEHSAHRIRTPGDRKFGAGVAELCYERFDIITRGGLCVPFIYLYNIHVYPPTRRSTIQRHIILLSISRRR